MTSAATPQRATVQAFKTDEKPSQPKLIDVPVPFGRRKVRPILKTQATHPQG
ncbi:hypothetical protein [Caudoviricetes sp.]|nr:hypothetical protein [Caudoviricetes sp.]UOF81119.1 hypothetical protein [Caudoviricetes sp.]UOF82245.1 hypothetical protein [Caudoviricetes sp.]UOF82464.1 hypothetical protein [Caudoviricetes sp.]UOF82618.1 hypothetical protein [Caudoviricetes sp.]